MKEIEYWRLVWISISTLAAFFGWFTFCNVMNTTNEWEAVAWFALSVTFLEQTIHRK